MGKSNWKILIFKKGKEKIKTKRTEIPENVLESKRGVSNKDTT